ncbi:hypothetical protein KCU73_g4541, partial [Aureobasidium melanogenum]
MATSQLGRLPSELQLMVMSYLEDTQTLYCMARVSTVWSKYAIDQLWKHPLQSALDVLVTLRLKSRRQFLAIKVRSLSLQYPKFGFETLKFSSLKSLSFCQGAGLRHVDHTPSIQPSLRSLTYHGEQTFAADSMNLVRQRCPNLRSLRVFDSSPFDSGLFIDLLRTRHHLETLSLGYGIDRRLVNEVLACLAGPLSQKLKELTFLCPLEDRSLPSNKSELLSIFCNLDTLHDLELGHHISAEQVSSYLHQHPGSIPFSNVHTLSLQGQAQAAVMLLLSRTITSLSLGVQHPDENFYTAVSSMLQLLSLDITFPPNETVAQGGLERLRTLLNLRRLDMSKSETADILGDMLQLPWMTDELFDEFFASFPLLNQLYLDWDLGSQLSEAAIDALARHCPSLRRAMLMWQHDLKTWHKLNKPLIPKLEFLGLGRI